MGHLCFTCFTTLLWFFIKYLEVSSTNRIWKCLTLGLEYTFWIADITRKLDFPEKESDCTKSKLLEWKLLGVISSSINPLGRSMQTICSLPNIVFHYNTSVFWVHRNEKLSKRWFDVIVYKFCFKTLLTPHISFSYQKGSKFRTLLHAFEKLNCTLTWWELTGAGCNKVCLKQAERNYQRNPSYKATKRRHKDGFPILIKANCIIISFEQESLLEKLRCQCVPPFTWKSKCTREGESIPINPWNTIPGGQAFLGISSVPSILCISATTTIINLE